MIGLGKSISHTKASILYGWNEEKDAKIVFRKHVFGNSPKQISREFKLVQDQNTYCYKNTLSFVLSPVIEDSQQLDQQMLFQITQEFTKQMKLKERQAIAFLHNDKAHKHIHLYVNRIDFQGKAYKDSYIGKYSQQAAKKTALKLGLTTIEDVIETKLENSKDIRKFIKKKHDKLFVSLKDFDFKKYQQRMLEYGIEAKPVFKKNTSELLGLRFLFKEFNLKASEVHRSLSINKLKTLSNLNKKI